MEDEILIVTEKELMGKHKAEYAPYEYTKYEVTPRSKFHQCYFALYEIPPQKASYPYHYHLASTEAFYILSGQGILETPQGSRAIAAGDSIVCPPGAGGAHRMVNTSQTEMLRYLDFDAIRSPDVVYYPRSEKTGIIVHNQSSTFFANASATDYYEGESHS